MYEYVHAHVYACTCMRVCVCVCVWPELYLPQVCTNIRTAYLRIIYLVFFFQDSTPILHHHFISHLHPPTPFTSHTPFHPPTHPSHPYMPFHPPTHLSYPTSLSTHTLHIPQAFPPTHPSHLTSLQVTLTELLCMTDSISY